MSYRWDKKDISVVKEQLGELEFSLSWEIDPKTREGVYSFKDNNGKIWNTTTFSVYLMDSDMAISSKMVQMFLGVSHYKVLNYAYKSKLKELEK